jgi:hypothetical protein
MGMRCLDPDADHKLISLSHNPIFGGPHKRPAAFFYFYRLMEMETLMRLFSAWNRIGAQMDPLRS